MPTITISGRSFTTQRALHGYLDAIRNEDDNGEFHRLANSAPAAEVLLAIMTTRPRKAAELGQRKVVRWTRRKNGPHWAFHAELDDGTLLDLGVNRSDISEFWQHWRALGSVG